MDMMEELHPQYELVRTLCEPADVGHFGCSRQRTYVIGAHEDLTTPLEDPLRLHDKICRHIRKRVQTTPADYFLASDTEILLEAQEKARTRKVAWKSGETDLRYLLNAREQKALAQYESEYRRRTGKSMEQSPSMVCFLGDNPSWSLTWSFHGQLPTYRKNSGLYWIPALRRWLTAKERLLSLGWPVVPQVASAMCSPLVPALDVKRASDLAGNSMHFLNTGMQQLVALASYSPAEQLKGFPNLF